MFLDTFIYIYIMYQYSCKGMIDDLYNFILQQIRCPKK